MGKGVMWLVALVLAATVSGQSLVPNSSTYLDAAVTGFDPFFMTATKVPNPGRRSKVFQPLHTLIYEPNKTVLNTFVDEEQDGNYLPHISVTTVVNFNQYLDFATSSAYKLSSDADRGAPYLRYENYSSSKTMEQQQEHVMFQFFNGTGGEMIFAKMDIVTHTITISPFEITTFTEPFQRAIKTLHTAAINSIPEIGKCTFKQFIRVYGTHFSRRTLLGSRAILGKLFSRRAATVEEAAARRQCVLEAAREALTPCMRRCRETTQSVFTRASAERCGGEEHEDIVVVTGPLPDTNLHDWASAAKRDPSPLFHELEPLSTLFNADWFPKEFSSSIQGSIKSTELINYFTQKLTDYRQRSAVGGSNSPPLRGCGLNSDCGMETECRNEPDTESGFSCIPKQDPATTTTSTTTTTPAATTTTTTGKPWSTCPACPASTCSAGVDKMYALVDRPVYLTSHPGYDGSSHYDNDMYVSRLLEAPPGYKISVYIWGSFHTGAHDNLYIHDGSSPTAPQLAKISGNQTDSEYTSSGRYMFLLFTTNWADTATGFRLRYMARV